MKRAVLVALPLAGLLGAMPALAATGSDGTASSNGPSVEATVAGGVTLASPDAPAAPTLPDPRPVASSTIAGVEARGTTAKDAATAAADSVKARAAEAQPQPQPQAQSSEQEQSSDDQQGGSSVDGSADAGGASVSAGVVIGG